MFEMGLDEQIRQLIQDAPEDGVTPGLVEAIAPVLKEMAARLRHLQYYIAQTIEGNWAITLLNQEGASENTKQVIYAFPSLQDVSSSPYPMKDPQMIALPMPVIHVLFQMMALETIDSLIFFDVPGNVTTGIEIRRDDVQSAIQAQLQKVHSANSTLPPDIA
jgi:hypothetical protein